MSIYRRQSSSVWWVTYTDASGKRARKSTGTQNRREAEALEAKWKLEAHQERHWDKQPERSFDELMLGYLKSTEGEKRSGWLDRLYARRFYRFFSGRVLSTLCGKDVRAYIASRKSQGVKPATINRELALLSAAINYARREWEWDVPNPVTGRKLCTPEGRVRWITRAEAVTLIQVAESLQRAPHLADFIRLALNTGCRRGELLGLEWSRVDLHGGLVHLEPEHTKTARRRSIPINREARQALMSLARFRAEYCPQSPWVFAHRDGRRIQSIKRSFRTACDRAGIQDFRVHDLRHTCAAWLVTAKVHLPEVRDLLGHSTIKMTERYAHLSPDNVRAAVASLDGGWSHSGHSEPEETEKRSGPVLLTA